MKLPDKQMISVLHKETLSSVSAIESFKKDLLYRKGRLEEIAAKNSGKGIHIGIEQFSNKLLVHDYELSKLLHDFNENEKNLTREAKLNGLEAPIALCNIHEGLMERYKTAGQLFKAKKNLINSFPACFRLDSPHLYNNLFLQRFYNYYNDENPTYHEDHSLSG